MTQNKLAPHGRLAKLGNFLANSCWAIVWLGRWTIRLLVSLWQGKKGR